MSSAAPEQPARTTPDPAPPSGNERETRSRLEVDVWYGSCSGLTLAPWWLVCALLTAGIGWGVWYLGPLRWPYRTFFVLSGAVWLAQVLRWSYRVVGYNYRLTTRRLFRDLGFRYTGYAEAELVRVARVEVGWRWYERPFNVGFLRVELDEPGREPLVLEGVSEPLGVAELIREVVRRARVQDDRAAR
jgi:hypothetical protein